MIDTSITKQSSPAPSHKKYPAPRRPKVQELRKKYESSCFSPPKIPEASPQSSGSKQFKKSKVKQMASRISQIMRREAEGEKCSTFVTELSSTTKAQNNIYFSKPIPVSKRCHNNGKVSMPMKSKINAGQESMSFFLSEDNYDKLTVKDKAQLYTQFINEMSQKNSTFGKHIEVMETKNEKEIVRGEVVNEKQQSVKRLLERIEAKCTFPRQTVSPQALQKITEFVQEGIKRRTATPKDSFKSKEFEDIFEKKASHISTLVIRLQPTDAELKKERRSRSLPSHERVHKETFNQLDTMESSHKRNNDQMRSSLPIEAYAPPKKIRRTRSERLTPNVFFQNPDLKNSFLSWLSEKEGKAQEQIIQKADEVLSKTTVNRLLEDTIVKLQNVKFEQKKIDANVQTNVKCKNLEPKLAPRKKRRAPPVPVNKISATSSEISVFSSKNPSKCGESESGLSPISKVPSDDSQPDPHEKKNEYFEKTMDFAKPIKPPRKKKLRRFLTWKKDTSVEEAQPINSTDSDGDLQIAEAKARNTMLYVQSLNDERNIIASEESSLEPTLEELHDGVNLQWNTQSDNNSAGVSTTSNQERDKSLETSECIKSKTSDRPLTDSNIDQGFETGSNDMDSPTRVPKRSDFKKTQNANVSHPLFIKLIPESQPARSKEENRLGSSTPIKDHLQQSEYFSSSPTHHQPFSPITIPLKNRRKSIYDAESTRSSLSMQVIREDQPFDNHEMISLQNSNTPGHAFVSNASNLGICANLTDKASQFWIKCGDFSISLDIFYNDAERLRLLYDIFSQKSCDSKDLHFGIDNQKFSVHHTCDGVNVSKRLSASKEYSHYWFATGDLAIPFSGKHLSPDKVERLFEFIRASAEESELLRFGVDAVEFSNVTELWNQSPKFSFESNYSMLVGLQSGNSNGLEGRSKFAWPRSKPVRISDLDNSDYGCDDFLDNDSSRLSFSPFGNDHFDLAAGHSSEELAMPRNSVAPMNRKSFGYEFENVSVTHLFDETY